MINQNYSTIKKSKYSWHSKRYISYNWFQSLCFWFGILFWLTPMFWLVRIILYLIYQNKPLEERLDIYATQMVCFGGILFCLLSYGIIATMLSPAL